MLELSGITKSFPGCLANDAIDLALQPSEIHALLGENGAGKSTLVKIVYGVLKPTAGTIHWRGQPVVIGSPAAARRLGIAMVFQHFSLFDSLTVTENIALGLDHREPLGQLTERIAQVSERYGLKVDPGRHVHSLSVGERQRVEIVRCLLQDPELLIMDEPTSVLTPQEADALFETLRHLAAEGRAVLYISHKLEEIRALCVRATVLRGGRVVAACDPRAETAGSLAEMMIGSALAEPHRSHHSPGPEPRLVVERLSTDSTDPFAVRLKDVSFAVHPGEIFGIAGVAGNGQAELMAILTGESPAASASAIRIDGRSVGRSDPRRRRLLGMAAVPEERLGRGAVPEMSLAENAVLSGPAREGLIRGGLIRFDLARAFADHVIKAFSVVTRGHASEARSLSGGNLQKFIVGREILERPRLLVAAAPTWGVDAGAAVAIHSELIKLADGGAAVLVISQDLDELFVLCDRIAVIFNGRVSASLATRETSVEQVGLLMGGMFGDDGGVVGHAA